MNQFNKIQHIINKPRERNIRSIIKKYPTISPECLELIHKKYTKEKLSWGSYLLKYVINDIMYESQKTSHMLHLLLFEENKIDITLTNIFLDIYQHDYINEGMKPFDFHNPLIYLIRNGIINNQHLSNKKLIKNDVLVAALMYLQKN